MRNSTQVLDFEHRSQMDISILINKVEAEGLLAGLDGATVQVFGADAVGKSVRDWQLLREFWLAYFKKGGANVSHA